MRLDNSPNVIFFTTVALTTLFMDFSIALLVNIPVYLIAQIWFHITKIGIMRRIGYYDNSWRVEQALALSHEGGHSRSFYISDILISLFSLSGMVGMVYIWVHLTFLHSDQLWFLEGIAFLGALCTLAIIWTVDLFVTLIGRNVNW